MQRRHSPVSIALSALLVIAPGCARDERADAELAAAGRPLAAGDYAFAGTILRSNGASFCDYATPDDYYDIAGRELGSLPITPLAARPGMPFDGACRFVLPVGDFAFEGGAYASDGLAAFCRYAGPERYRALTGKELVLARLRQPRRLPDMRHDPECGS